MDMEFLGDLIEYMPLKWEVGNSCLHSLEDRPVPAAYAIHRIVRNLNIITSNNALILT